MTDTSPPSPSAAASKRSAVAIVILPVFVAAVLRIGFVVALGAGAAITFPDEKDYWSMAQSLAAGETMADTDGRVAARMPGYPAFLAVFANGRGGLAAARIVQALLASLTAGVVAFIGLRVRSLAVGLVAGLLVAIDPFNVFFSRLLLVESLLILALWSFVALVLVALSSNAKRPILCGVAAGIALAVAVLLHPTALFIGAAILVLSIFIGSSQGAELNPVATGSLSASADRRLREEHGRASRPWHPNDNSSRSIGQRVGFAAVAALVVVAALLPWTWRNHEQLGAWVVLTTRGGITLYDGVGPQADGGSDLAYTRDIPEAADLDETAWNDYFARESRRLIRAAPARIAALAGRKFVRTWSPLPNAADYQSPVYRIISAAWVLPIYLLTVAGVWSLRRRTGVVLLLLAPAVVIAAVHLLLPGSVRYRLPAMPGLELLAAAGLVSLTAFFRRSANPAAGH